MNDYDPRRDQRLTRISSWVTGEKLMNISYASLSADMLAADAPSHRANPDKVDWNGQTKRDTYQAATRQDINYFNDWARILNAPSWLQSMTSERNFVKKGEKVRPIDIPPEIKRSYAAYILIRLNRLVKETAWLLPTIIGFRPVTDFPDYINRKDGVTIQDVYASTVWRLTQDYGPWVVLIDLEDAFGRLPHRAVHEGLKALWIPHDDRRRALEAIRIRTTTDGQKILKPKSFGVEQGNPLSPIVFNVVMSLLLRRMNKAGVQMASYGDDIVLVSDSEKSARKAFDTFMAVTSHMGFQNVRPLGTEGKATRIYDTTVEPVPLIKTYLVGKGQIALQDDKEEALKGNLQQKQSVNAVKKANTWKVVSKTYFKTLIPGENRVTGNSLTVGSNPTRKGTLPDCPKDSTDGSFLEEEAQDDQDAYSEDVSLPTCKGLSTPYPTRDSFSSHVGVLVSTHEVSNAINTGLPQNGRVPVVVNKNDDGPEVGVTLGHNGTEGRRHCPSIPNTVLSLTETDIVAVSHGRRLRAGNRYRREGAVMDLRGLQNRIPECRLHFAVGQIARVSSKRGRVEFLVHPGESWSFDPVNFSRLRSLGTEQHPCGQVLIFSRANMKPVLKGNRRLKRSEPPVADVAVLGTKCLTDDARRWSVTVRMNGRTSVQVVSTSCINPGIARLEAIANVLSDMPQESVVIPVESIACHHLLSDTRVTQVGLHAALTVLRRWTWNKADDGWLLGRLNSNA